MARNLNKATLIGNLTRDPELRYTPQGTAVCSFSVATNRQWKTESGDLKDDVEFHRIVAWNQLAEICSKMLKKGSKVYVEGRLQTRQWEAADGQQRNVTEIVISDMIALDSRRDGSGGGGGGGDFNPPDDLGEEKEEKAKAVEEKSKKPENKDKEEEIPF